LYQIRAYQSADRHEPFSEWLERLADRQARARIRARLDRVALGNLGDCKTVGKGVSELRIAWGPGYRVYFARVENVVLLLLCGGDKTTQQKDIQRAQTYLQDFQSRI
jgi:putative addiction module killer protein